MYHLFVKSTPWSGNKDALPIDRALEGTPPELRSFAFNGDQYDVEKIRTLPALFVHERIAALIPPARIGHITDLRVVKRRFEITYQFDDTLPLISSGRLFEKRAAFGIEGDEFACTHWTIKDVDLYKAVLSSNATALFAPKVFTIKPDEDIKKDLVSVMMPLKTDFDPVFDAIKAACLPRMSCLRADKIWENDAIIQDIVSLINRSRIVICDYSEINPNVFYETGIAHTLGRDVIPIAQSSENLPFDVRHFRGAIYTNDEAGRALLTAILKNRIATILGE